MRSDNIFKATQLGWLIWLVSLSACIGKYDARVVIPDSRTLHPAVSCTWEDDHGKPSHPTNCAYDPYRVNIDLGYLREILEDLDACRKAKL